MSNALQVRVKRALLSLAALAAGIVAVTGCGSGGSGGTGTRIIVNSLDDLAAPPTGTVTLRSALAAAAPGDTVAFDRSLSGGTITLSLIADEHTVLKGEFYNGGAFGGYTDRDYGKSALYVTKPVTVDASGLPGGITVRWGGGDANPARVMAVLGDLTMRRVTISGGRSIAEAIAGAQAFTLARGGGLAVWGIATLDECIVTDCKIVGDTAASRDRGTYGGGIYANGLNLTDCVISGNSARGAGAGGGGIYSVGGADSGSGTGNDTRLERCAVTGNRVTAQHAYGGGIFTLSGGPLNLATMTLVNCTIARNLVEDNPDLPQMGQYYYRGGGVYMGGGSLTVLGCTIAENAVTGTPATFSNKPNMGGGGVAATVGNAHTVEFAMVQQSAVVGNTLNGVAEDWYAGSVLSFTSRGYNIIGAPDFSQILVPVPEWMDLSRKHFPKVGDQVGVTLPEALSVGEVERHATAISAGTDAGQPAVVWYPPAAAALDKVPVGRWNTTVVRAGYVGAGAPDDDFLNSALAAIRTKYAATLGATFGSSFGDMTGTTFHGPAVTWPSDAANSAWIKFWRDVDTEIAGRLGPAGLEDTFWAVFATGQVGSVEMTVETVSTLADPLGVDQRERSRPTGARGDIGAVER